MRRSPLPSLPVALICLCLTAIPALAAPRNLTRSGLAVAGHDVVAYFTDGAAVEGSEAHALDWDGARWRFVSAAHRELFAADPEKYAPRYGGYCAYAMSRGDKVKIDPEAFSIVDGKLYLNYSLKVRKNWDENRAEYIDQADDHWRRLSKP